MIKLIYISNDNKIKVTLEDGQDLTSMLRHFECFLRGSGYVFDHLKTLTLAEEDDVILSKEEYNELVNKSKNGKSKRS